MEAYLCDKCSTLIYVARGSENKTKKLLPLCPLLGCTGKLVHLGKAHGRKERDKRYRKRNKKEYQRQQSIYKKRCNEELISCASFRFSKWDSSDIEYLRSKAKSMTSREIADVLGRTMIGVQNKASKLHIPMLTYEKTHGQLKTDFSTKEVKHVP